MIQEASPQTSPRRLTGERELLPNWDVSAITPQALSAIREFLDRRDALNRTARLDLAGRLANGLGAKAAGAELRGDPEAFLQTLAELKSRSR